jgi:hypothetical protein
LISNGLKAHGPPGHPQIQLKRPTSEDPRDDRVDVGVEVERERQSAAAPREAPTTLGGRVEITGSPPHRRLPVLTDGAVDHGAVVMVERERIVDVSCPGDRCS